MDRLGTPAKLAPKPVWSWLYGATALGFIPFALVETLIPEGAIRTALEVVAAAASPACRPVSPGASKPARAPRTGDEPCALRHGNPWLTSALLVPWPVQRAHGRGTRGSATS